MLQPPLPPKGEGWGEGRFARVEGPPPHPGVGEVPLRPRIESIVPPPAPRKSLAPYAPHKSAIFDRAYTTEVV